MARDQAAAEITRWLGRWRTGDEAAFERLLPLVYEELRRLAASLMRREHAPQTLEATALVHEVFLKLQGAAPPLVESRGHFFAVAARSMRQLLVDRARRRGADKRGGQLDLLPLTDRFDAFSGEPRWLDVLAVDQALERLERISARRARVVELRFFAGLEDAEIAEALEVSLSTVEREWRAARAYLRTALDASPAAP